MGLRSHRWPTTICAAARRDLLGALQPGISKRAQTRKLNALTAGAPTQITTANIGYMTHQEWHRSAGQALDQAARRAIDHVERLARRTFLGIER